MPSREDLIARVEARAELERRRRERPLAYARLWDNPEPRTSQLRAFRTALQGAQGLYLSGGNGTGKTWCGAIWALLQAMGSDHPDAQRFAALNGLDLQPSIPTGPAEVWVASETFAAARKQIRGHLRALAPVGSTFRKWDADDEAELHLPGGGVIVSKAYTQYTSERTRQTWEGAQIRAVLFDEQPPNAECMTAAFARTRATKRPGDEDAPQRWFWMLALTPLRGKDWLYRKYKAKPTPEVVIAYLNARHNPHLDQRQVDAILAAAPGWQRKAREEGIESAPEGQVYALDPAAHQRHQDPLPGWVRWMGIDWGARSPHVLWACEPPGGEGPVYVYREYAPRRTSLEQGIRDRELIEHAQRLEAEDQATIDAMNERRRAEGKEFVDFGAILRVADSESVNALEEAAVLGWYVAGAEKPKGSVRRGIDLVEAMLATKHPITGEDLRPRLYISPACGVLWEELEGMHWPAHIGERQDADEVHPLGADHGPDALRYILSERDRLGFR